MLCMIALMLGQLNALNAFTEVGLVRQYVQQEIEAVNTITCVVRLDAQAAGRR